MSENYIFEAEQDQLSIVEKHGEDEAGSYTWYEVHNQYGGVVADDLGSVAEAQAAIDNHPAV